MNSSAIAAGVACYVIWGFVPLVFQAIGRQGVSAWEILAHRTIWATPVALVFVLLARQWPQVVAVMRDVKVLRLLCLSAALIACNWCVYIWAVNSGRLLETSLGYYITPLINMATGALFFRERITGLGKIAVGLATVGVVIQTAALGHVPLVSLVLGISFGAYGLVRKQVAAEAQTGLFIECLILSVPGLAYMFWLESQGASHLTASPVTATWLVAAGPITAVPLLLFAWAARRIPLSLMGFLQFIAPTIAFVIGLSQGEAFTPMRALSFAFIWAGAGAFVYGAWTKGRTLPRPA
ncbi:EamA family transporter RarD [Phenylobacterium koreense]|uniref:Chloramphenicol-sensitive protein RarD n=2 Tax=Phenylobacterium TaxID=20 RepID=A0ABV2EHT6_9CAUL